MKDFVIAGRKVGPEHPPLVMAEVGINHDGSIDKAVAMVDAAVESGCELVKFQCHITDKEMIPTDMRPGEISDESLWDIMKRCELDENEERRLQSYCVEKGAIYLSTPFSREAADRLDAMGVPAFKIGSGECNNIPLLEHVAAKGKPMIISTGMNDIASIRKSVGALRKTDVPLALMHCCSMYPTPHDKVRLGAITELQSHFPDLPIGLSDHSLGIWTCLGGVALGACLLEKHFTISRDWPGPDTAISIEPNELVDLITGSRAIWQARGGRKTILPEERPVIEFAYATVVTTAPIGNGQAFTHDNTWVKRPGIGKIPANDLDQVLGRAATRDLPANVHIEPSDVDGL